MDDTVQTYDEALAELAADALSEPSYAPFLAALLRTNAGTWVRASHLCRPKDELHQRIDAIEQRALDEGYVLPGKLSVRWQEYPPSEGFCTVMFFLDVNMWNWMMVYNRAVFLQRYTAS